MAGNSSEGLGDDFFEQILAVPSAYNINNSSEAAANYRRTERDVGSTTDGGPRGSLGFGIGMGMPPLGLNLEAGFLRRHHDSGNNNSPHLLHNHITTTSSSSSSSTSGITERDHMTGLFSAFGVGPLHAQAVRPMSFHNHRQPVPPVSNAGAVPQAPGVRPRVRARRGQATDPHSIAERLRRERIAERMKALQELVPTANKTDRAAMLDEIVDYVKFLRLQVKVLSMSRLGGAGAVAQLVADVPLSAVQGEGIDGGKKEQAWEKWSNDGTEQQVAELMEEDVGAAMQFLQSKALCLMPVSLASAVFPAPQSDIKPESSTLP